MPIPKQTPVRIDKLRPVSLTSIFEENAKDFVSSWVLNDINEIIDKKTIWYCSWCLNKSLHSQSSSPSSCRC